MNKYLIEEIYLLILGINKGVGYFYILYCNKLWYIFFNYKKNFVEVYVIVLMRRRF